MTGELRVVVCGMTCGVPGRGGAAWAVLQYVLGLRRLGHDVTLLEPLPAPGAVDREEVRGPFDAMVARYGLAGGAALLGADGATAGMSPRGVRTALAGADLLLNLSGMLRDEALLALPRRRVYLDLDPGFTQAWEAQGADVGLDGHERFVTVGPLIGSSGCPVPTGGRAWIGTAPPVVLERWPPGGAVVHDALTSVGDWRGYGVVEHDGLVLGQRAHSARELRGLPAASGERILLALAIDPAEGPDLAWLREEGWELADPVAVAGTPWDYMDFVAGSRVELGIAKSGYVVSRCGWFSDRSACYLASGRPVVAQDTGFREVLPVGEGLLTFADRDGAAAAIEALRGRPEHHSRAARAIAEAHLDSDRVLTRLLEVVA